MSLTADGEDIFAAATTAVAALASQTGIHDQRCAPPVVASRRNDSDDVVVDAGYFRLTRTALRAPIDDYVGQLQAPQFHAAARMAIAAATGRFPAELTSATTDNPRDSVVAEHFRTLAAEWRMRDQAAPHMHIAAAAATTLWPVERYCGDTLVVFLLLEILPRVDSTTLPRSAGVAALEVVREHARAVLPDCVALWREATLGTPGGKPSPSASDWISHAHQWNMLMQSAFPTARWSDTVRSGAGFTASDRILTAHPCGSDLADRCRSDLSAAAVAAASRAADMLALVQTQPSRSEKAANTRGKSLHAGGTEVGDRTVSYRPATDADMRVRRTFLAELADAGHRSPSLAPTPVPFPSGRLHTRALIARTAQMAAGRTPTAMPWTAMRSQPRAAAHLSLALVVDSSATMLRWANHTATLGWAAAHAVAQLGGVCAVWGFAGEAFPIIEAGAAPAEVPVVEDRYAGSAGSVDAMRSALDATRADDMHGVLAVVTDGKLPDPDDVCAAVDDLVAAGTHVVWVLRQQAGTVVRPNAAVIVEPDGPQQAAVEISRAILATLSAT